MSGDKSNRWGQDRWVETRLASEDATGGRRQHCWAETRLACEVKTNGRRQDRDDSAERFVDMNQQSRGALFFDDL